MADWDEIKKLAADFQRTQASDTLQKISERNCIDIVKKLTDLNLIELIYTCDGKQFITPSHLLKEIEDEVYYNGGRMQLHDLATKLNVDYQHIENKANELAKANPTEYNFILGQIIHSTYKDALSKQINDKMLFHGQLSVAEFAKSLDLPTEFLLNIINELLPRMSIKIVTSQDGRTFYTSDMMDEYKSIIVGSLSAVSKPTTIASLTKRLNIPERILLPIIESSIREGRLDAHVENRQYVPVIFAREQNEYVSKFYASNSYIEYDMLVRMDIKQPRVFLKKKFPDGIALTNTYISPILLNQLESVVEETVASDGWIDACTVVSTAIEPDDINNMLLSIFKKSNHLESSCHIFDKTYVCTTGYIKSCIDSFDQFMSSKAQEDLEKGRLVEFFMVGKSKVDDEVTTPAKELIAARDSKGDDFDSSGDETPVNKKSKGRRSTGGGGGGGSGSQGRERKQKSVKKKYFVSSRTQQKQTPTQAIARQEPLALMSSEEMTREISKKCTEDCSDYFLETLVNAIQAEVNERYRVIARKTLDEYLKKQEEERDDDKEDSQDEVKKGDDETPAIEPIE